jgi:hypothetical protein
MDRRMETDDLTQERIALNQARFREANERIELAADNMGLLGPVPFICECADETSMEIVRLDMAEYEEVRQDARLFVCAPGHQAVAVENGAGVVVSEEPGHVLVRKTGVAGRTAEEDYRRQNQSD